MSSRKGGVLIGLSAALLLQIWLLSGRDSVRLEDLHGPVSDSLLPTFSITPLGDTATLDLRTFLTRNRKCSLSVFMDVNCSVCGRMRYSWPREYSELLASVGQPIEAVWIFGGEADSVNHFVNGFRHPDISVVLVHDVSRVIQELGVFGTPITYLVDARGRKRIGIAGNRLPPADVVSRICEPDAS
jgi:hypothetical protein